jgi:heat shock protein HspQ
MKNNFDLTDLELRMSRSSARFHIGQVIHHRLFDYRGVVVDVDPVFSGSEQWYDHVARSRPPKDKPWYRDGRITDTTDRKSKPTDTDRKSKPP